MSDPGKPSPPGPKRAPSRPEIIIDQTPEDGVTGQRRFDLPKRSATLTGLPAVRPPDPKSTLAGLPAPPPVPPEHAPTLPAQNPLQRQTIRRPTPPSAVAQARRTDPPTVTESVATESPHSERAASREAILEGEIAKLRDEFAKAGRDARAAAEAKLETYPPQIVESVRPPAPAPAPKPVDDEPTPRAWKAALFKVVVGLGALLTAAATILGVRANTAIEPKVETNAVRTKVVEVAADTLTDRVTKLEAYARAETKRRQCVEAQLRDALARGTGHVITTLPSEPTGWSEQNSPKNEPRLYWKTPTWFTAQGCDAAPSPP